jgi:hypothetical protein
MSKFWNYFGMLTIAVILANLLGILNGGAFSTLFTLITDPSTLPTSTIYTTLFAIISAGIATTFIGSYRADMAVIAPFLLLLLPMGLDVLQLISILTSLNVALGLIVGAPTIFLFMITCIEWWRGTDN